MDAIYDLKEMLCKELEEYGEKGELTPGSLEVIDKLAHAVKNLHKIIEAYEEEEYSGNYGGSYQRGGNRGGGNRGGGNRGGSSNRGSYARGGSYARRRDSRGRYSREGGYSREAEEMVEQLRELMQEAPDNQTRMELERMVQRMEQM